VALMYGWMVFVEHAPERYDWAVKVMTAGRLDRIKDQIAEMIEPGQQVLDIGCGTGTLAVRCMRRGARVTGLDSAAFMLEQAQKHAAKEGLSESLTVVKDSVTQIHKHFPEASFDVVTATMSLGEFPREYLLYILGDCRHVLRPGGRLIVADETWPTHAVARMAYRVVMTLFWVPQFLLLRRAFFPIRHLEGVLQDGGFHIERSERWRGSSFRLVVASVTDADVRPAQSQPSLA
jgi:ubiquinone/menaquinone biosynthesis C-methylase UbiE